MEGGKGINPFEKSSQPFLLRGYTSWENVVPSFSESVWRRRRRRRRRRALRGGITGSRLAVLAEAEAANVISEGKRELKLQGYS